MFRHERLDAFQPGVGPLLPGRGREQIGLALLPIGRGRRYGRRPGLARGLRRFRAASAAASRVSKSAGSNSASKSPFGDLLIVGHVDLRHVARNPGTDRHHVAVDKGVIRALEGETIDVIADAGAARRHGQQSPSRPRATAAARASAAQAVACSFHCAIQSLHLLAVKVARGLPRRTSPARSVARLRYCSLLLNPSTRTQLASVMPRSIRIQRKPMASVRDQRSPRTPALPRSRPLPPATRTTPTGSHGACGPDAAGLCGGNVPSAMPCSKIDVSIRNRRGRVAAF